MNENQKTILLVIEEYLQKHPDQRFCQALFNLGIVEFADKKDPAAKGYLLRDGYNDTDETILKRISEK